MSLRLQESSDRCKSVVGRRRMSSIFSCSSNLYQVSSYTWKETLESFTNVLDMLFLGTLVTRGGTQPAVNTVIVILNTPDEDEPTQTCLWWSHIRCKYQGPLNNSWFYSKHHILLTVRCSSFVARIWNNVSNASKVGCSPSWARKSGSFSIALNHCSSRSFLLPALKIHDITHPSVASSSFTFGTHKHKYGIQHTCGWL